MGNQLEIFGKNVRAIRRARDMTQEQLADQSGLSLQYIGEIERGRRNPSLTSLEKLAEASNLPLSELLQFDVINLTTEEMKDFLFKQLNQANGDQLRMIYALHQAVFRQPVL